jgi:hypothetical protein
MTVLIINGYAHRIMSDGEFQTASVYIKDNGDIKIRNDWKKRLPEEYNLTGGEFSVIKEYLLRIQQIQLNSVVPLPKAEEASPIGIILDKQPEPL